MERTKERIKKETKLIFFSLILMFSIAIVSLFLTKQKIDMKAIGVVFLLFLVFFILIRTFRYYLEKKNIISSVINKKISRNYEKIFVYGGIGLIIISGINLIFDRTNPKAAYYFVVGLIFVVFGKILLKRKQNNN
jgi:Ca2+/Na+ antiporter